MPWLWTDDLAALLIEQDGVGSSTVVDWTQRPVALAVAESVEPLDFARTLLDAESEAVA